MTALRVQLILVAVLVVLNAAFAGSELALISLRRSQVDRLKHRGRAGKALAELTAKPNEFLATIQIGITLAGFLASATAATAFAEDVAPLLGFFGDGARAAAIILVTLVLTFVTLVGGELAPKRIALARAEGWALAAALPLRYLAKMSRPAVWMLSASTNLLVRMAGVDPHAKLDDVSDDELREMLLTRGEFDRQRQLFKGTFEVAERVVREVLVPRRDVTMVPTDASVEGAIEILKTAGHTRAPLADDLDHVEGVVHLNDLAGETGRAADHRRPAVFVPETLPVLDALRWLQRERQQLAIVIDEYGGGAGVLSLEDALEEIVGEIYDEFDTDQTNVNVGEDGSVLLDGAFPVHDLSDIDIDLPEGPYTTVAGLLLERLGRIPEVGEHVDIDGWRLTVLAVDDNAIKQLRIEPRDG